MKLVHAVFLACGPASAFGSGGADASSCSGGAEHTDLQSPGSVAAACQAGPFKAGSSPLGQVGYDSLPRFDIREVSGAFAPARIGGLGSEADKVGVGVSAGLQSGSFGFDPSLLDLFAVAMIARKNPGGKRTQRADLLDLDRADRKPLSSRNDGQPNGVGRAAAGVGEPNAAEAPAQVAGWLLLAGLAGLGFLSHGRAARRFAS